MYDSNGGDLFTYAVTMDSSTSTPLSLILIDTSDSGSFNSMIWPKIKPSLVNNVNGYVSISHFDDDHIKNAVASLAKISQKAPDGADPKDPRTLREALDLQDDDKNHILNVGYNSVSRIMLDLGYTYNDVKSTFKPTRDGDYMDDYKANLKANDHWKCDCDDADGCLNVVTQIQSVVTNSNSNGSIAKRDLAEDYDLTMMRKTDGFFTQFPADKCLVNKIQLECDFKTGQGSNLFLPLSNPLAVATTIWPSKKYFLCEAAPVLGGLTGTVRDGSVLTNAASTSMILRPRCNDMNLPSLWGVTTGDIYTTDELPKLQEALKPYVGTSAKFLFLKVRSWFNRLANHYCIVKVPHHGSDRTNDEDFFKNFQATVYLIGGGDRGDGNPDVNVFKWILRNRRPDVNVKWDATSKKCYYDITPNGGDPIYIALSKGQLFDGKGSENFLPSYFGDTIETSEKNCKEKCWTPSCRQYSLLFIDEKEMGGFISLQTEIGTTGEARAYIRGRGIIGINCNVIAHGACQSIGDLPGFLNEIEHYDKEFEKILNAKRQTMSKGQKGNSRFNYYRAQKSKDYGPVIVHWYFLSFSFSLFLFIGTKIYL